jgi:hypothetical protein
LFIADAYWLPPDGDPIGPMALGATCTPHGEGTQLRVRQAGCEESQRWSRYYEVLAAGSRLRWRICGSTSKRAR